MTLEEALNRIEACIQQNMYSQIWDQNLFEEIDAIRSDAQKDLEAAVVPIDARPQR